MAAHVRRVNAALHAQFEPGLFCKVQVREEVAFIAFSQHLPTLGEMKLLLSAVYSEQLKSVCFVVFVPQVGEAIMSEVMTGTSN